MARIRPEITGCKLDTVATVETGIGYSRGPPPDETALSSWIELHRIIPLQEAARLAGCSIDTLKRNHKEKIVKISAHRYGMRVGDALFLT
jgi:hypothetical protein